MLKNFVVTTVANSDVTVCSAASGKELCIASVMINGGNSGGEITLAFSTGFTAAFTVDAHDIIILDNKINIPEGASFTVNAATDGMKVMVSAAEFEV